VSEGTSTPICPSCGYDLTGVFRVDHTATCPECGFEGEATTQSKIRIEKQRRRSVDRQFLLCISIFVLGPGLIFLFMFLIFIGF
jgi:uncharacterized membrane protein YvbJ